MDNQKTTLDRGEYCGSISVPFPSKRWLIRCCVPVSLLFLAFLVVSLLSGVYNFLIGCICLGAAPHLFWATIFRGVSRVDIYQNEVLLYARLLFFDTCFVKRIKRSQLQTVIKKGLFGSPRLVFIDKNDSMIKFSLTTNSAWTLDTIESIQKYLGEGPVEDFFLQKLDGEHIDSIVGSGLEISPFLGFLEYIALIAIGIVLYLLMGMASLPMVALIIIYLVGKYEYFVRVNQVDVYERGLYFWGDKGMKYRNAAKGYIVNPDKATVQDTVDLFRSRVLKIKKEGSPLSIRLSKRHGWSDEDLDKVKAALSKIQGR